MWIAVKIQTSPEIAGSPRNSLRASLKVERSGGRALTVLGGSALTADYQTPTAVFLYLGVRLWVIRFIVKRATAQIVS